MKRSIVRAALGLAIAASTVVGVPASHAGVPEGWVPVATGEIAGTGPEIDALVQMDVGVVAAAAKDKVCTPSSSSITPGALRWSLYQDGWGGFALYWHAAGYATASDDCPEALDLTVVVDDYAPAGQPAKSNGDPGRSTDSSPSSGYFSAAASSDNFVVYSDPQRLYWRGDSVVEVKVTARYYNRKAKAWVPLGCKATHTQVHPDPLGRSVSGTTGPAENCAA